VTAYSSTKEEDMLNIVLVLLVLVVGLSLFCVGLLTWRAQRRLIKWAVTPLVALSASALCIAGILMLSGLSKMQARAAPAPELMAGNAPAQVHRGEAIVKSFCARCHAPNGTLTGGFDVGKDLSAPIGTFIFSNLTPAGHWAIGRTARSFAQSATASMRTGGGSSLCPTRTRESSATRIRER
jgi:cytochrome c553